MIRNIEHSHIKNNCNLRYIQGSQKVVSGGLPSTAPARIKSGNKSKKPPYNEVA